MAKIKVTKIKSVIDRTAVQKKTMEALGLRKMNQTREFEENNAISGMIARVKHLVKVEKA